MRSEAFPQKTMLAEIIARKNYLKPFANILWYFCSYMQSLFQDLLNELLLQVFFCNDPFAIILAAMAFTTELRICTGFRRGFHSVSVQDFEGDLQVPTTPPQRVRPLGSAPYLRLLFECRISGRKRVQEICGRQSLESFEG